MSKQQTTNDSQPTTDANKDEVKDAEVKDTPPKDDDKTKNDSEPEANS